ncbi:MAG TPA: hypothetical protein VG708_11610 [Mycobacteriales bacterium]|nr:hypothetical protein [Mycobacteriales bacterium]
MRSLLTALALVVLVVVSGCANNGNGDSTTVNDVSAGPSVSCAVGHCTPGPSVTTSPFSPPVPTPTPSHHKRCRHHRHGSRHRHCHG